jgi:hypothetical protein
VNDMLPRASSRRCTILSDATFMSIEVGPRTLNIRVRRVPPVEGSYPGPLKTCHVRNRSSGVLMTCEGRNTRMTSVHNSERVWDIGNTCSKVSNPLKRRATSKCDEVEMKEVTDVAIPKGPCNE